MDATTIEREALHLPVSERARLAHKLLISLEELSEAEVAEAWLDEAERRAREIDEGLVQLIPAEEVSAQGAGIAKVSYRFHPGAEAEHFDAIAFFESRQVGLGAAYLTEFEASMIRVAEMPHRYRVERKPDIRFSQTIPVQNHFSGSGWRCANPCRFP